MKIKVEQRHIDHGKAHHCEYCPTALGVNEATGGESSVSTSLIEIRGGPHQGTYFTPLDVVAFIDLYDHSFSRHLAEPFEFELGERALIYFQAKPTTNQPNL